MFQANPYYDTTLKIDESAPLTANLSNKTIDGLSIEPNAFDFKAKCNHEDLEDLVARIPDPGRIKAFEVSYDAHITRLPDIERFTNLEYLHLAGRQIKDVSVTEKFPGLKSLFVVNHKNDHLKVHQDCRLEKFRAIRGRLATIDFSSETLELQSCSKLARFGNIESRWVQLDGCHQVDLDTLGNISGLVHLEILGRKALPSFDFLLGCNSIKKMAVTATDVRQTNTDALARAKALKKCFLGQCSQQRLSEIAANAPDLLLTNGDIALKGGEKVEVREYYDES